MQLVHCPVDKKRKNEWTESPLQALCSSVLLVLTKQVYQASTGPLQEKLSKVRSPLAHVQTWTYSQTAYDLFGLIFQDPIRDASQGKEFL